MRRYRNALLGLIAVQLLGYLLVWFVMHWPMGAGRAPMSSEHPVSTGLYDATASYRDWFMGLPAVDRLLAARLTHRLMLAAGLGLASAGYLGALWVLARSMLQRSTSRILAATVLIALPLLLMPQLMSSDVWSYAIYGRIAAVHGGNPFVDLPSAYPADPFFNRLYWKETASVYGPAWVLVSAALIPIAGLCGSGAFVTLMTFKLFLFLCHLASVALIGLALRRLKPARATLGMAMYAWNPLVLFEFAGNAHNDAFMLVLILAGIALATMGRPLGVVAAMMLAGLAKLTGLLGLPAYTLYVARTSSRPIATMMLHVVVAAILSAALYLPFWHGAGTFHGAAAAPNFYILHRSPAAVVSGTLEGWFSHERQLNQWIETPPPDSRTAKIRTGVRRGSLLLLLIVCAVATLWPIRSIDGWIERMIYIFAAYILFGALYFNPWYGTWLIPFAALAPRYAGVLIGTSLFLLIFYLPINLDGRLGQLVIWPWPLLLLPLCRRGPWRSRAVAPDAALQPVVAADAATAESL